MGHSWKAQAGHSSKAPKDHGARAAARGGVDQVRCHLASDILRRLGSYSRKNKLYFALRELGYVVRTMFLLRYISEADLRQAIQSATNKSERFNEFVQWISFGGDSVIAENVRDEQRKFIKYNHLVANILAFHNIVSMT